MRIALCLSGQLRNVKSGFRFINENIIQNYDVDTYVHTYWNQSQVNKSFTPFHNEPQNTTALQDVLDLYKPRIMTSEPPKQFDLKTYQANQFEGPYRVYASLSMFSSIYNCYKTIINLKDYDFIVRCRFDLGIMTKIDFTKLEPTKLYTKVVNENNQP